MSTRKWFTILIFLFVMVPSAAQEDGPELPLDDGTYALSPEAQQIYDEEIANADFSGLADAITTCDAIIPLRMFITAPTIEVPENVTVTPADANGINGAWFTPEMADADKVLYYIHGGGFIFNSVESYTPYLMWLAHLSGYQIFSIDYRLAPEHPFPAASDDVNTAYWWLLEQGYTPENIAVAGDSAGGNLAIELLLNLRDSSSDVPAAGWLYAPVVDFTRSSATEQESGFTGLFDSIFTLMGDCYMGEESSLNPQISPLFADLQGLPPLLISVGTRDALLGSTSRFAQIARDSGVDVRLDIWDGMWHVWSQGYPLMPESMRLHKNIGIWLDSIFEA